MDNWWRDRALGPVGVWSMELRNAGRPGVAGAAAELTERGLKALWIPGLDGNGVFEDTGALLSASPEAHVVLGVLGIWRQTAGSVSARVRELDARYGERTVVGFGVSDRNAAAAVGQSFDNPVGAVGNYLDEVDIPAQRLLLGAMGPRMATLAAERTAGIHPFLVSPDYTAKMRAELGGAAVIAPHQAVVFSTDATQARQVARDQVGMFIGFDAYRNNLRRLGWTDEDLVPGGSDRLIDALVAWGDDDAVRRRLREQLDAGADHVAVQVLSTTPGAGLPLQEWRRLADLTTELN
ncbi:TIGR03620 family F420-dependent LLM class oxidoreductase [Kribbella sp. DT2]|uniref:TIGR03620 family F420-dependent LLM class oxidoreductase n=1 Tax=Kribbella sp. DT2 TaxID=3393427 RepID=UPI003CF32F26